MLVLNTNQNQFPAKRSNAVLKTDYPDFNKSVILILGEWEYNIGSTGSMNINGTQCFVSRQIDIGNFYGVMNPWKWFVDVGWNGSFLFPNNEWKAMVSRITTSWTLKKDQVVGKNIYFDLFGYTKSTSSSMSCKIRIKIKVWILHTNWQIDYHWNLIDDTVSYGFYTTNTFIKTYTLNSNGVVVNEWDRIVAEIIGWKISWWYSNDRYCWIAFGKEWSENTQYRPHGIQISVE